MTLKLFIADESILVIDKLSGLLSDFSDLKIVGFAVDIHTASEKIRKLNPDVVIMDIHFLEGNGLDLLKQIKREYPSTIVIVFTNHIESNFRNIYLKEGADYFLDKSIEFVKIIDVCNKLIHVH